METGHEHPSRRAARWDDVLVGLAVASFAAYLISSAAVREWVVWVRTIISRVFLS